MDKNTILASLLGAILGFLMIFFGSEIETKLVGTALITIIFIELINVSIVEAIYKKIKK